MGDLCFAYAVCNVVKLFDDFQDTKTFGYKNIYFPLDDNDVLQFWPRNFVVWTI